MEFNKDDVIKVARALLEDYTYFETGDYSKDQYVCEHCEARSPEWSGREEIEKFRHETDCPVLVARDLLTGAI